MKLRQLFNTRPLALICFCICLLLIGFAYYLEWVEQLYPCPLCVVQRGLIILIGFIFLITALHNPKTLGRRLYAGLIFVLAILGVLASGRQLWLQAHPSSVSSECLPGLSFLLKHGSIADVMKVLTHGTDQCALVTWQFLHLSIPGWTLIFFCFFVLAALSLFFKR